MHSVTSAPSAGALITTLLAPALRWSAALSRAVNSPVDSTTTCTPSFLPRQLGRVALGENLEGVAVDHDLIALGLDLMLERAVYRVILEQMGQRRGVGDVVDRDDLELFFVQHARKNIRPIRPKPLIPILIATAQSSPESPPENPQWVPIGQAPVI